MRVFLGVDYTGIPWIALSLLHSVDSILSLNFVVFSLSLKLPHLILYQLAISLHFPELLLHQSQKLPAFVFSWYSQSCVGGGSNNYADSNATTSIRAGVSS